MGIKRKGKYFTTNDVSLEPAVARLNYEIDKWERDGPPPIVRQFYESGQTDKKTDKRKKTRKTPRRTITREATACARAYKKAIRERAKKPMSTIVKDYVGLMGGSESSILKTLYDNPQIWKKRTETGQETDSRF